MVYTGARGDSVAIADGRALDSTANFKEVVVAYAHDLFAPVDDDCALFDNTSRAYDDGACDGEDGCLRMHDSTCADGNIAFQLNILTDDGLGVDRELVSSNE